MEGRTNRRQLLGGAVALETARRALLVVSLTVLAGATVFVDEVVHGRRIDDELAVDAIVGVLLAATACLATVTVLRLRGSRAGLQRHATIVEAARAVSGSGQSTVILAKLPRQAVEILGVDVAYVARRDESELQTSEVVAGIGVPREAIGWRCGIDEGIAGRVFISGKPVLVADLREIASSDAAAAGLRSGGAVPIRWAGRIHGALVAGSAGGAPFGRHEIDVLTSIADLGATALEQVELREHLERAAEAGIEALATAVDMRDNYTAEHSEEVVRLAREVGQRLGLDDTALADLDYAARLHDVGKIGVPDEILRKPGELGPDEWQIMRKHPVWGAEMLARLPELAGIAALVRFEHERWDGSGYPDGLRGEEIPQASRIVFACDAYHAMTSDRPYRQAIPAAEAIERLRSGAGSQFDPAVVDALVASLPTSTVGS